MKRAVVIVLDSVGIGELPDAGEYGDTGSNTIGNIASAIKYFRLPNLERLGLGKIEGIKGIHAGKKVIGSWGRMAERSAGKDTTTGHWEIMGVVLDKPFPVYPHGFPKDLIEAFEKAAGTPVLGNVVASGTEIIKALGDEHVRSGYPIVYTSADSVFQIAAHEQVIPLERLYQLCTLARNLLKGEHGVGRVIARPFVGSSGNYSRTEHRRDFSLDPTGKTVLESAVEAGLEVWAVGKIEDIFNRKGITRAVHIHNNMNGVDRTLDYMKEEFGGILFTNLVDFDMVYGHRNDVEGYAAALSEFDSRLPEILDMLNQEDLLIITADHGCDPTTASTDHSREYVPLLVYGECFARDINLGTRDTFADLGATVAEFLGLEPPANGKSFYAEIMRK